MDGKVLIIGGRSGIGFATSVLLAEKYPGLAQDVPHQHQLDVTYHQGMARFIREHGPYSHIVFSAGINRLAFIEHPKIGQLMEDMTDINTVGFVALISAHLREWPAAPVSAVAVSSDAARIPMRGSVAYCASKAALNMAVRVMGRELAPLHRINAVAPGMVEDTPMTDYIDDTLPDFRGWARSKCTEYERQNTPSGRRATKEEVAETIAWLLFGPEQMTGAILDINGGR